MLGEKANRLPAVLKRKLTIELINPGRSEPILAPRPFRPFPIALPVAFRAFVIDPTTAPIVMPAAIKMPVTVTPYFLKISRILSQRGMPASLSSI